MDKRPLETAGCSVIASFFQAVGLLEQKELIFDKIGIGCFLAAELSRGFIRPQFFNGSQQALSVKVPPLIRWRPGIFRERFFESQQPRLEKVIMCREFSGAALQKRDPGFCQMCEFT